MNIIIKILIAELSLYRKEFTKAGIALGIIVIGYFVFDIINSDVFPIFITTVIFTTISVMESRNFKDKLLRFTKLPISSISIFIVQSFRLSSLLIIFHIFFMIIFGISGITEDNPEFNKFMIFLPGFAFLIAQFLIAIRDISNIYESIWVRFIYFLIYIIYALILINGYIYFVEIYNTANPNIYYYLFAFGLIGLFTVLLLLGNYKLFQIRGEFK